MASQGVKRKAGRTRSRRMVATAKRRKQFEDTHTFLDDGEHEHAVTSFQRSDPGRNSEDNTDKFVTYYETQGLLSEKEWPKFMAALRKPLPVTFRVNQHVVPEAVIRQCLEEGHEFLHPKGDIYDDGRWIAPPRPLKWCNSWQLGCSSFVLKHTYEPYLQRLRDWLARYCALGVLVRQEVVSMIPVAFLDVQPDSVVLDMCASPGSKTTQVIDALHSTTSLSGSPTGSVTANDADPHRAYILVRRCNSLSAGTNCLLVTQHQAQKFPNVLDDAYAHGIYDRIVCDVPCCGDGTLRKSPDMWRRWHPGFANDLHKLQLKIAMRGFALLTPGGVMAYSTCTFNPVEDEAVVVQLLKRFGPHIELVDVSSKFPSLKRRPGVHTWTVFDDEMNAFESIPEDLTQLEQHGLATTMFPPQDVQSYPLERCMRFFPHLQDTGGFFVALLRKVSSPVPPHPPRPLRDIASQALARRGHLLFRPLTEAQSAHFAAFFGLEGECWRTIQRQLFSRSSDSLRCTIVFASPSVAEAGPRLHSDGAARLRHVSLGTKILETRGRWRKWCLTEAGAALLAPNATKRVLLLPRKDIDKLLRSPGTAVAIQHLSSRCQKAVENQQLSSGPCIVVLKGTDLTQLPRSGPSNLLDRVVVPAFFDDTALSVNFSAPRGLERLPQALAAVKLGSL